MRSLTFVFLLLFAFRPSVLSQDKPVRRVLILNEAGPSYPAISIIDQGIRDALANSPYQLEFYREYLDALLFPDPTIQQEFWNFYIGKYRDRKPDVILTVGPTALRFVAQTHRRSFPGVPVIFCLLDGPTRELSLDFDFTGIENQIAPAETLDAALRLQPGTKHVVVVGGISAYDKQELALVRDQLRNYEGRLDISFLTDLAMPALLERLKHLPDDSIVLFTSISEDTAGTKRTSAETGPMVAAAANAPVFTLFDVYLNHGEVGGDLSNLSEQGKAVGSIALRILGGEQPKDIPVVKAATTYMFDWRALRRWGLKESNLPPGSVVLYRQFSFWESYKYYIIASAFLFSAQMLLILALLWQRARRRRTEEALKKSQQKFRKTFERSPLAVTLTGAQDNRYLDVNETFQRAVGWSRDEIIGRTPFELGIWVDPEQRVNLQRRILSGGGIQNIEFTFRTKTGEVRTGLGSAELIEIDDEPCILSVATDITERKEIDEKMKRTLREGEERFRIVANTAPVMIWMSGIDKRCIYVNRPWLEFTGRSMEAELGEGWAESIYSEDLRRSLDTYTRAFERREPFQMEYRLRRHDGEYRWVFDSGVPRYDASGCFAGYIGSALDVTERKRAEEALSTLGGRLIEAQEQERRHLARELHDDIGQRLVILSLNLQKSAQSLPDSDVSLRSRLERAIDQAAEIAQDLRVVSHRLHSSSLEALGLVTSVRGFCQELVAQRHVEIDYQSSGVPDHLPQQVSLCLFRVLQEGLNNAVKHSGTRHFEVRLERRFDEIQLTIRDQGCGFDSARATFSDGIGLISMRERVSLLKGTLAIISKPGAGTEIKVSVPFVDRVEMDVKGVSA